MENENKQLDEQIVPAEETAAEETVTASEGEIAAEEAPVAEATDAKKKPKKSWKRELLEWVVTIVAALAIAFVIRTFVCELVVVDGHSMDYTLADTELMLVTKPEYLLGDPERFDVVVCHYPNRGNTYFVKRVVGLPGDTVAIQDGYLYVNGVKYEEEYIVNRPNYTLKETVVPEGQYFVLGDNRSNSNDSHTVGPLDRDMILGKVHFVLFPFDSIRAVD